MPKHSPNSEAALQHLNRLKPNDGWSLDTYINSSGEQLTMLRRRNIPLHDSYFDELILDSESGCVIGKYPKERKGAVLVEKDGSVCRERRPIEVKHVPSKERSAASAIKRDLNKQRMERERVRDGMRRRDEERRRDLNAAANGELTDVQKKELLKYGFYFMAAVAFVRIFAEFALASFFAFAVLLLPVLVYASLSVPPVSSFDAKKELKRVLRGHHLPENHPDKPKGWLQSTFAKVAASVTAEVATSVGYEVQIVSLQGLGHLATVKLNANDIECYWIGAFDKWWYVYQREVQS